MTTGTEQIRLTSPLPAGSSAPDFALPCTPDQRVSLSEFRGRPVIFAFYRGDWNPVCSDQRALYQELLSEFRRFDAALIAISVDSVWSHLAFARDRNLHFPPTSSPRARSPACGVYRAREGRTERAPS